MSTSSNSTLLYHQIDGTGQAIVFLHGFLEDSSMWSNIISAFKNDLKTILIDLPCHGKSRFSGDLCSMEYMANKVEELLSYYQIEEPVIIGHSMGGYVGLELLKRIPGKLVLLHSNFWEDPVEKKKDRNRVIDIVAKNPNLFISESIPNLFAAENKEKCKSDIAKLISKAKEIPSSEIQAATAGMRDRLANFEIMENKNVSVIQGEHDPIIPAHVLKSQLEAVQSEIKVITIPDCGHMSIWEAPDQLITTVNNLLKSRN